MVVHLFGFRFDNDGVQVSTYALYDMVRLWRAAPRRDMPISSICVTRCFGRMDWEIHSHSATDEQEPHTICHAKRKKKQNYNKKNWFIFPQPK